MLYVLDQKFIFWAKMDTDLVTTDIKEEPLTVEETDDSCLFQYFEVVPLDRDTDGSYTTECVSGDCPAEVKQEDMAVVKNEPDNVYCTIFEGWLF